MGLSGGTGQPTKPQRRKRGQLKLHKKATAPTHGRRASVAELQDELNALKRELQQRTRELSQALERETATAEVLNVISRSTFQLQPVLDTIVQTASHLCNAETALIFMFRDEKLHLVATSNVSNAFVQYALEHPLPPGRGSITGRTFLERQTIHLPDCLADPEYALRDFQAICQHRSMLGVPLLRDGSPIGVITLWRTVVLPFTDTEVDLVQTFADQAVIAIENVHLFEAEQERTRELTESLQQQTATADVLKVISRSTFDLQTVLDTLVESAAHLCDADSVGIMRPQGAYFRFAAQYGYSPAFVEHMNKIEVGPSRGSATGRVLSEGRVIHIPDVLADPDYGLSEAQRIAGFRTVLGVPLLREGTPIGVMNLTRSDVRPFTDKQIELVSTFADQAVIAIENTRLLNELRESLRQQTATADVLKIISRATFDLPTVLDALLRSAGSLCEADMAAVLRPQDERFIFAASFGLPQAFVDLVKDMPISASRGTLTGRVMIERHPVHIPDVLADPEYSLSEAQKAAGYRSILGVPLSREGIPIGIIILMRSHVRP
ncbi:MAG: GAF domain-containing protein, partial [Rhodoplanes sp.]